MTYLADWQTAKRTFETATGRKKPSQKFLGAFRGSSGLENACKALDDSLKKPTVMGTEKAMAGFETARQKYLAILDKADHDEHGDPYRQEIANLREALVHILTSFTQHKQQALNTQARPLHDILGPHFDELVAGTVLNKPSVRWFLKDKAVLVSGADGRTKIEEAAQIRARFQTWMNLYKATVDRARGRGNVEYSVKDGVKLALDIIEEMMVPFGPLAEDGAPMQIHHWALAQQAAFLRAGQGRQEANAFIRSTPAQHIVPDLQEEAARLSNLTEPIRALVR